MLVKRFKSGLTWRSDCVDIYNFTFLGEECELHLQYSNGDEPVSFLSLEDIVESILRPLLEGREVALRGSLYINEIPVPTGY